MSRSGRRFRLSLRTILLTTTSIAVLLSMAIYMPNEYMIKPLLIVLALGVVCFVPAASFGYDMDKSMEGVLTGVMWGYIFFVALITVGAMLLPRVHS